MLYSIQVHSEKYTVDSSTKIPCFFSLVNGSNNPRCFYLPYPNYEPFQYGDFIGSVGKGGSANCMVLTVAPHGCGTHTECVGHITEEEYSVYDILQESFFLCYYSTIGTDKNGKDSVVSTEKLKSLLSKMPKNVKALALNINGDFSGDSSGGNPPYFFGETMELLVNFGIEHLVVNTPSVDKEEDEGVLESHHIFWNYKRNGDIRVNATITEYANFPEVLNPGLHLLEIQIAPFTTDASPSRIFLYPITDSR